MKSILNHSLLSNNCILVYINMYIFKNYRVWATCCSLAKSLLIPTVREKNKQKLLESCIQWASNEEKIKTKTAYVFHDINNGTFSNEALPEIKSSNNVNTKTIILARCGLLECGKIFKGTIPEICRECIEEDDESHRLNRCVLWKHLNFSETAEEIDFGEIL